MRRGWVVPIETRLLLGMSTGSDEGRYGLQCMSGVSGKQMRWDPEDLDCVNRCPTTGGREGRRGTCVTTFF